VIQLILVGDDSLFLLKRGAISMTNEEIYEEYNIFVRQQLRDGIYNTIPHCDARILHLPKDCEYCNRPEWQEKRAELRIAPTGYEPKSYEIPCEADAKRGTSHLKWGGNKPTISLGDESWPEETNSSKWMYGDPLTRPEVPIITQKENNQ
jgi:hypothetical protein